MFRAAIARVCAGIAVGPGIGNVFVGNRLRDGSPVWRSGRGRETVHMHAHDAFTQEETDEAYELDESGIRVVGRIGTGAMASVLRALMPDGRPTAVKLLMPRHMANPEVAERFVLEGDLMRSVRSPHVPEIYATGTTESGQPYYAMELLHGVDLERLLEESEGRVHVHDAIRYGLEACAALVAVHGTGILHRDVKPANLFLAHRQGELPTVVLLDFGIAKRLAGEGARETTAGLVVGTPSYMSPEQVRGAADIDVRSDVWAIGTVLYELVTGRAPFERDLVADTLHALLYTPAPPLRNTHGDVPDGLEELLLRCLEKEPARRFATVEELARALAPLHDAAVRSRRYSGIEARRSSPASAPPPARGTTAETMIDETSFGPSDADQDEDEDEPDDEPAPART